jgi:glycosyltransferase involved in cell wall biosynthesis
MVVERRPHVLHPPTARVGIVSTYPPSRCGIGRFTASLVDALERSAPHLEPDIVRLIDGEPERAHSAAVSMEFDPDCPVSLRAAARHLSKTDAVMVQHEYGIFGGDDGVAVVDLIDHIEAPVVSVLHTVLEMPTSRQRRIVERIGASGHVIVPSESARQVLTSWYDIDPSAVSVIGHGSSWAAAPERLTPRNRLISWGLLGPGKGFERAIEAVAALADIDPPVTYQIVGQTHPKVLRNEGQAYRRSLMKRATDLGVDNRVEFVDRYLDDDELYALVCAADVVVAPYDNAEQVSSGVLIEALSAGRPVVATRFPHAVELLSTGAGIVVDHDDGDELTYGIRALLEQPALYERATRAAGRLSREMSWDAIADRYAQLFSRMIDRQRITA